MSQSPQQTQLFKSPSGAPRRRGIAPASLVTRDGVEIQVGQQITVLGNRRQGMPSEVKVVAVNRRGRSISVRTRDNDEWRVHLHYGTPVFSSRRNALAHAATAAQHTVAEKRKWLAESEAKLRRLREELSRLDRSPARRGPSRKGRRR